MPSEPVVDVDLLTPLARDFAHKLFEAYPPWKRYAKACAPRDPTTFEFTNTDPADNGKELVERLG